MADGIKDKILNAPDQDLEEWLEYIVPYLEHKLEEFDTHAMSSHQLYLQGRKDMLKDIIIFIEKNS